jgi:hypothetical protein
MPLNLLIEIVVVVLIAWLIGRLIRSSRQRAELRRQAGPGPAGSPYVPQAHYRGALTPSAPSPASDAERRPALTVAAEIAGILGLIVTLITLIASH